MCGHYLHTVYWVVVAEWLARWTCDCEVPGSNRARRKVYHATVLGQYCICTKTHALGQPSLSSLRGRQIGSKLGSWRQRVIFRLLVAAVVCLRVKWDGHSVSGEACGWQVKICVIPYARTSQAAPLRYSDKNWRYECTTLLYFYFVVKQRQIE